MTVATGDVLCDSLVRPGGVVVRLIFRENGAHAPGLFTLGVDDFGQRQVIGMPQSRSQLATSDFGMPHVVASSRILYSRVTKAALFCAAW